MHDDYSREPVPQSEQQHWFPISLIWIAIGIDLSAVIFGVQLGGGMQFSDALISVIIGSFLLGILAAICAYVGAATGLSTSMISRYTFGSSGSKIVSLFLAVALLGWFGVQTGFFAENAFSILNQLFGVELPTSLLAIFGGLLMTSTAMFGFRAFERLSKWAVPLLIATIFLTIILAVNIYGISELSAPVENTLTYGMAISLTMSVFITGAVISPDISRWARSKKDAILASFLGFFVGNSFMIIVAMVLSRIMNENDLTVIMVIVGLGIPGVLVLILAQWTTNVSNAYSSGLGLAVVFTKISKMKLTLIAGLLGTALAFFGIYDHFLGFLNLISIFITPIAGVYTAVYYFGKDLFFGKESNKHFNILPLSSWFVGAVANWLTSAAPTGLELFTFTTISSLDGFIVAFLTQIILIIFTRIKLKSKGATHSEMD